MKNALLKRSLRQKPTLGVSPLPEMAFKNKPLRLLVAVEDLLRFFHVDCKAAVAALPFKNVVGLTAAIDCAVMVQ